MKKNDIVNLLREYEEKMPCGITYMQELEARYQDELMVWENDKGNKE